jgi:DNA-directed RNA polymerase subunit K/omega
MENDSAITGAEVEQTEVDPNEPDVEAEVEQGIGEDNISDIEDPDIDIDADAEDEEADDIDDDDEDTNDDDDDDDTNLYKTNADKKKTDYDDKNGKKNIFDSEKIAYSKYDQEVENLDETDFNKFNDDYRKNHILNFHNECLYKNFDEIKELCKVLRNKYGVIVDELHKTIPLLTKYEKTKVLGMRLKQLNSGCKPYISTTEKIIDNNIIAQMELEQKVLPFIIQRPLPNNTFEYWKLQDLDIL